MEAEETFFDHAPVTPAHKFAWRAFKGFVYGSPESPENMGKENTYPARISPQKRVSLDVPALSPQKRKRDPQLSPTKSILRTPGAPTPRAKSLRDVNVKFKSISPELQRNFSAPAQAHAIVALEHEVDNLWQELEHSLEVAQNSTPQVKVAVKEKKVKTSLPATIPVISLPPPTAAPDIERDAYARRTEKEVKRLLRQHKKLRDYARRADEQNVVLQAMVDGLRNENARLKTKLERQDRALLGQRDVVVEGRDRRVGGIDQFKDQDQRSLSTIHELRPGSNLTRTEAFKRSLRGENPMGDFSKHKETTSLPSRPKPATTTRPPSTTNPTIPASALSANAHEAKTSPEDPPTKRAPQPRRGERTSTTPSSHPPNPPQPQPQGHTVPTSTSTSVTTKPPLRAHPSPISLTALAAQLEPPPTPAAAPSHISSIPHSPITGSPSKNPNVSPLPDPPLASINPNSNHTASNSGAAGGGLSLAPNRVAAARLRLAKKREERGLGNATSLAFAIEHTEIEREVGLVEVSERRYTRDVRAKQERGSGKRIGLQAVEESVVDWAGL